MEAATALGGVFSLVVLLFLIVLALLWFLLPFAVFGIKDRLDTMIRHQRYLMDLLERSEVSHPVVNEAAANLRNNRGEHG